VLADVAQTACSSVLVIIADASSAEELLAWSLFQAGRRHGRVNILYVPALLHDEQGRIVEPATVEQGRKELSVTLERLGAGSQVSLSVANREESTIKALRTEALRGRHGLVMVGPLDTSMLVRLVFGSDPYGVDAGLELPLVVVPPGASPGTLQYRLPPRVTVGFRGSEPAIAALGWAVAEAERRDGVVRAVMAWCEGDHDGLGGPVPIAARRPALVSRSAQNLAADSLSRCGVRIDRVSSIARRGMPAPILIQEAAGSDLLAVGAGGSVVHGYRVLGAITLACLAGSPVPVVIVPTHAAADVATSRADVGTAPGREAWQYAEG
jgi:nucleotide-binding universal stress UspA family protein